MEQYGDENREEDKYVFVRASSQAITKENRIWETELKWAHIFHEIRFRYLHIIKEMVC